MCGLWGMFNARPEGTLIQHDIDVAQDMMVFMSRRGDHSSGICTIPRRSTSVDYPDTPNTIKAIGSPYSIIHTKAGQEYFKWVMQNGNSIFGHNRKATTGAISLKNAHPFEEGDWILVHNGTIRDGVKVTEEVEVDSHALCVKFNEVGIKEALKTINGAYAIMAYHKPTKKMYFARNHERELWYFNHMGIFYMMSEDFGLRWTLKRNNHYFKDSGNEFPILFPPEKLFTIEEGNMVSVDSLQKEYKKSYYGAAKETPASSYKPPEVYSKGKKNGQPTFLREDDLIYFKVIGYSLVNKEDYEYECESVDNSGIPIMFHHRYQRPDLIGKFGVVDRYTRRIVCDKPEDELVIVKFLDIEWDMEEKLQACDECAGEVKFDGSEIKTLGNKYICGTCVNEFMKNGSGRPPQQANA